MIEKSYETWSKNLSK